MKVAVFYNKGVAMMSRFDGKLPTPAELITDYAEVYHDETERDYICNPDDLFAIFNDASTYAKNPLANEKGQAKLKALGVFHTSMSVGDIVQIGEAYHLCQPAGWTKLVTADADLVMEDGRIADNMRDYWTHQRCGAE